MITLCDEFSDISGCNQRGIGSIFNCSTPVNSDDPAWNYAMSAYSPDRSCTFFSTFQSHPFQNGTLELTEARCSTAKQHQYEDHKGIDNYAAILGVKVVMEATFVDWEK